MPTKPPTHRIKRVATEERKEAWRFYGSTRWKRMRVMVLNEQPLCVRCEEQGLTEPAMEVDHIIDRVERPDLAFERGNLQGLCKRCHSIKTRRMTARMAGVAK